MFTTRSSRVYLSAVALSVLLTGCASTNDSPAEVSLTDTADHTPTTQTVSSSAGSMTQSATTSTDSPPTSAAPGLSPAVVPVPATTQAGHPSGIAHCLGYGTGLAELTNGLVDYRIECVDEVRANFSDHIWPETPPPFQPTWTAASQPPPPDAALETMLSTMGNPAQLAPVETSAAATNSGGAAGPLPEPIATAPTGTTG